jgi:hypothetical protein
MDATVSGEKETLVSPGGVRVSLMGVLHFKFAPDIADQGATGLGAVVRIGGRIGQDGLQNLHGTPAGEL